MVVVGVNIWERSERSPDVDPFKKAKEFKDKHGLTFTMLVDSESSLVEKYGVRGVPTNVIIDKEGKVRYLQAGFRQEDVMKALEELVTAK